MDKMLVVVAPDEGAAYAVVRALKALDDEGSIELYSSTVITRSGSEVKTVEHNLDERAGLGTVLGLTTGTLLGLLAGPAGAALGAAFGGTAGLGGDLLCTGIASDFVHDVSSRLNDGAFAVVASVSEGWTAPVDEALAPLGVTVFRQATDDVAVAQIRAEMKALDEEVMQLDAEIATTAGEAKAKLEAKRAELRAKQEAQRGRLRARANKLEQSWQARLDTIKEKAAAANARIKARHEQHMEKLSRFAAAQKRAFGELFH